MSLSVNDELRAYIPLAELTGTTISRAVDSLKLQCRKIHFVTRRFGILKLGFMLFAFSLQLYSLHGQEIDSTESMFSRINLCGYEVNCFKGGLADTARLFRDASHWPGEGVYLQSDSIYLLVDGEIGADLYRVIDESLCSLITRAILINHRIQRQDFSESNRIYHEDYRANKFRASNLGISRCSFFGLADFTPINIEGNVSIDSARFGKGLLLRIDKAPAVGFNYCNLNGGSLVHVGEVERFHIQNCNISGTLSIKQSKQIQNFLLQHLTISGFLYINKTNIRDLKVDNPISNKSSLIGVFRSSVDSMNIIANQYNGSLVLENTTCMKFSVVKASSLRIIRYSMVNFRKGPISLSGIKAGKLMVDRSTFDAEAVFDSTSINDSLVIRSSYFHQRPSFVRTEINNGYIDETGLRLGVDLSDILIRGKLIINLDTSNRKSSDLVLAWEDIRDHKIEFCEPVPHNRIERIASDLIYRYPNDARVIENWLLGFRSRESAFYAILQWFMESKVIDGVSNILIIDAVACITPVLLFLFIPSYRTEMLLCLAPKQRNGSVMNMIFISFYCSIMIMLRIRFNAEWFNVNATFMTTVIVITYVIGKMSIAVVLFYLGTEMKTIISLFGV